MALITTFIAGAFALLGSFVGAKLGQHSKYEIWLRKEKSDAFRAFYHELLRVRLTCTSLIYCESGQELISDSKISESFLTLESYECIVRLYISRQDRSRLSDITNEFRTSMSRSLDQTVRLRRLEQAQSNIQELFEHNLIQS